MRINLIFNSFWGVVLKFWQIIFETFLCKFAFNFEIVYTSKFRVLYCGYVRQELQYIPILQINWQTSLIEYKVEFQLL